MRYSDLSKLFWPRGGFGGEGLVHVHRKKERKRNRERKTKIIATRNCLRYVNPLSENLQKTLNLLKLYNF
jgi:hypothetical protein